MFSIKYSILLMKYQSNDLIDLPGFKSTCVNTFPSSFSQFTGNVEDYQKSLIMYAYFLTKIRFS